MSTENSEGSSDFSSRSISVVVAQLKCRSLQEWSEKRCNPPFSKFIRAARQGFFHSVEIFWEKITALGGSSTWCLRPRRSGIPNCDILLKVDKNIPKKGGQGVLPLGCLPLWGREGVTLKITAPSQQEHIKLRFSTEPIFSKILLSKIIERGFATAGTLRFPRINYAGLLTPLPPSRTLRSSRFWLLPRTYPAHTRVLSRCSP